MLVVLTRGAELVGVALHDTRSPHREDGAVQRTPRGLLVRATDDPPCQRADVGAPRPQRFRIRTAAGHDGPRRRATFAVLGRDSTRDERGPPRTIVEVEARAQHDAPVAGHVGPPVVVQIVPPLAVHTGENGIAPSIRHRAGGEADTVRAAARGLIHQHVVRTRLARTAAHEVDHAAERRAAVQRRRGALDHLDAREVHRRDVQQPQPAGLSTMERQAVRQHERIAPAQALHADVGAAERGVGGLHAKAARLVEHHGDVARRHADLLGDLVLVDHFDPKRRVLHAALAARSADDHSVERGRFLTSVCRRGVGARRHGLLRPRRRQRSDEGTTCHKRTTEAHDVKMRCRAPRAPCASRLAPRG
jgi:hypothetical protein